LTCDLETNTCVTGSGGDSGGGGGGDNSGCQQGMDESCYYNGDWTDGPCSEDYFCDPDSDCTCQPDWPWNDPIIIDLAGAGYTLTNLQSGVFFDFFGTGTRRLTSWTAAGANVGFLALDRNGNGRIDDGTELFSNISPQPRRGKSGKGNGFLALAEFDKPENGGNGDGWITNADAIFPKLLVWVDKNHDGISQPSELFSLTQAGIQAISLDYRRSRWKDDYGNIFRYRSAIIWCCQAAPQWIYDVLLQVQK
jgi:hypothetical protein